MFFSLKREVPGETVFSLLCARSGFIALVHLGARLADRFSLLATFRFGLSRKLGV